MILKSIKIVDKFGTVIEQDFLFDYQRHQWLRESGFYQTGGLYLHLDGRCAGLFDKKVNGEGNGSPMNTHVYDVCANPLKKTRSVWSTLLGDKKC